MANVTVKKRGSAYQYKFEIAKEGDKRKFISKAGYKTKAGAYKEGIIALNQYMNTGYAIKPNDMSYSDFLDYWIENYCKVNTKYHTVEAYSNIVKNHIKPNLGFYKLSQISKPTLQEFINMIYVKKSYSKNFLNNIRKVLKCSFNYAFDNEYVKFNPASNLKLPKYDIPPSDPAHIFTSEEIDMILERFKDNRCIYHAFLLAYCTGLRLAEVFALTWDDIDFANKTISVNKNILKKNQAGGTKMRHISGNSTMVWYFGTCKTQTSYRQISIGDTLVNSLKAFKMEQEQFKILYGDNYMKHYKKVVINPFNNKEEVKIVNAIAEIDVTLPEVNFVFTKNNGVYEGTDSVKYPFKVIHYELGINCRFHDFRDTHATRLIESGADIKAVSKRLGHRNIDFTYDIYVRVTEKMENDVANKFEDYAVKVGNF